LPANPKLASFAKSHGVGLDVDSVLSRAFIERFVLEAPMSLPTRRTLKTNLVYLASHVPGHGPELSFCPCEHAKAPYTDAGAGLYAGELRGVIGTDVVVRSGGVLVLVKGKRPRAVPVLSPFQERLLEAAFFAGGDYIIGGSDARRRNVTNNLISSLAGGDDLVRIDLSRLRSNFLVAIAAEIGLRAFMDAAGISCSQRLGDLVAKMASPSEEQAVALFCKGPVR
jgi:hypothetical protein